jgi:ribose transport system substrate-binding protein
MGQLRFVLSLITQENDYQREQAKAAEEAARRLKVDLQVYYSNNDSVTQSAQILDALHTYKGALDGILVEPAGGTEFPQIGRAAVSAGIAWVVLNRDASSLKGLRGPVTPAFAVSANHTEVGRIQARQISAILPSGGVVLCIQGPSSNLAARDRMAGLLEAKAENLVLKVIRCSNWTVEAGHHATASWLRLSTSQREQIHVVAAQNDSLAMGGRKALLALGGKHWAKVPFLGVDGLSDTGCAWVQEGKLTATVIVPPVAGSALEIAVGSKVKKCQPHDLHLVAASSFPAIEALRALPVA